MGIDWVDLLIRVGTGAVIAYWGVRTGMNTGMRRGEQKGWDSGYYEGYQANAKHAQTQYRAHYDRGFQDGRRFSPVHNRIDTFPMKKHGNHTP